MYPTHMIDITMAESRNMMSLSIPHRSMINCMLPFPVSITSVNRFSPEGLTGFEKHAGTRPACVEHDRRTGRNNDCH